MPGIVWIIIFFETCAAGPFVPGFSARLTESMRRWSDHVSKQGIYLELADLYLMATSKKMKLKLFVYAAGWAGPMYAI